MRAVSVCPEAFPGVKRVLKNLESILGVLHVPLENLAWPPQADTIILGAWAPTYINIVKRLRGKRRLGVLWTSSLGEVDMSGVEFDQLQMILMMLDSGEVDFLWFGDPEMQRVFNHPKAFHCPYPTDVEGVERYFDPEVEREGLSLFCPPTLKKNLLNQLAAVKLLQRDGDVSLHLNNPKSARMAEQLGVKFQYHPWPREEEYYGLINKVKLGLQVSWAGDYWNYVVLDHNLLGVPVLTGRIWGEELPELVVEPESPLKIAMRIEGILNSNRDYGAESKRLAEKVCARSNEEVRRVMEKYLK